MFKKKVVILVGGAPGSGKSTISKKIVSDCHELDFSTLNIDKISCSTSSYEKWEELKKLFKTELEKDKNIILDATFRDDKTRKEFLKYIDKDRYDVIKLFFILPEKIAIKRAIHRCLLDKDHPIKNPEEIINKWYTGFRAGDNSDLYDGSYVLIEDVSHIDQVESQIKQLLFANIEKYT